jgi:hypothetical protein
LSTTPTLLSSPVVAVTTLGTKPAPPSVAAACVSVWPTTFGTATSLDALATVRFTFMPVRTELPAAGD